MQDVPRPQGRDRLRRRAARSPRPAPGSRARAAPAPEDVRREEVDGTEFAVVASRPSVATPSMSCRASSRPWSRAADPSRHALGQPACRRGRLPALLAPIRWLVCKLGGDGGGDLLRADVRRRDLRATGCSARRSSSYRAEHYEQHLAETEGGRLAAERRRLIVEGSGAHAGPSSSAATWFDPGDVLARRTTSPSGRRVARGSARRRPSAPAWPRAHHGHAEPSALFPGEGRRRPPRCRCSST